MNLRDYIAEKKIPTPGMIKKLLKSLDFENIHPEFFDIEKKNSDAGMGGYDYLQITFDKKDALSPKRASDVKLALMSLSTKYGADTSKAKEGVLIIEDANFEPVEDTKLTEAVDAMKVFNYYKSTFENVKKAAEHELDEKHKFDKMNRRILTDYAGNPKKLKEIYYQLTKLANNLSDDLDKLDSIIG